MASSPTQTSMRTTEEKYRQLFDQMLAGFALHEIILNERGDPVDYRFLDVNPAFERLIGLRRDAVVGKTVLEVFPRTESRWIQTFGDVALTGRPVHLQDYSSELDRYFEVTAFCPGEHQFAVTFVDVTERVRFQDEQKRLESRVIRRQKDLSLTTLAGGIAHEFNNNLMTVVGIADILRARHEADREEQAMAREIIRAGERMAHLTQQLLAYAKGGKYEPEPLDVSTVIDEALDLVGKNAATGIDVRLELFDEACMVYADRGQIQQMLINVFSNAFEALEAHGGEIVAGTSNVRRDAAWECPFHDLHPAGDYVSIRISDTGPGIGADVLERIFEPFVTTKILGRGLGLAAAMGIARNHGGCISVASAHGGGTSVEILLPRAMPGTAAEDAVDTALPGARTKGKILLVDDSLLILKIYETMLSREGYEVVTADGGYRALSVFEEQGPEIGLVVLDIQMPDLNGREVYKKLKEYDPELSVIIASGFDEDVALGSLSLEPRDAYIQKPFVREELLEKVRRRLQGPDGPDRPAGEP